MPSASRARYDRSARWRGSAAFGLLNREGAERLDSPQPAKGSGVGGGDMTTDRKPREPDTRVPRARKLRRDMTIAERKLWWHLRRIAPERSHFRRQATIGAYFPDFACHNLRLVIELDGGQHSHATPMEADIVRTEYLRSRGYRVFRFWNNDVLRNIDGVLSTIQTALGEAVATSPPPPTPPRHSAPLRGGRGEPEAAVPPPSKNEPAARVLNRAKESP
jgi:very-short-patch-repair endonuclease